MFSVWARRGVLNAGGYRYVLNNNQSRRKRRKKTNQEGGLNDFLLPDGRAIEVRALPEPSEMELVLDGQRLRVNLSPAAQYLATHDTLAENLRHLPIHFAAREGEDASPGLDGELFID